MIRVYCENITERHRYIFDFIFGDILGIGCKLTEDLDKYQSFDGPKFSYHGEEIPGSVNILPHPLLKERGIQHQEIRLTEWKGLPVFFQVEGPSALPFDPFALSFYLVSRYEEYLPFDPDSHGRFRPELSLSFKEGFLRMPLVDAVMHEFKKLLMNWFPGISFPSKKFHFIPSFDIDIAFAHHGKGWERATAAWLKLILKMDYKQARERLFTLLGKSADPYDNFNLHLELAKQNGHMLLYFVLLGDFGRFDRNTSHKGLRFRKLLSKLSLSAELGIHPSYHSHLRTEIFTKELERLVAIIGKPVAKNRFHFLRLKFPDSYRLLVSEGIRDDYSLGYSSMNGFRASTCTPFHFYDIGKEEKMDLIVHPFIFMDSAMIDHLKMLPDEATGEINQLVNQVRIYGGEAIGIWHNYSLSEKDQYKGWQKVLISTFKEFNSLVT